MGNKHSVSADYIAENGLKHEGFVTNAVTSNLTRMANSKY